MQRGQRVRLCYALPSVSVPVNAEGIVSEIIYPSEQRISSFNEPVVMVDFGQYGEQGFDMCLVPGTVRPIR